MSKYNSAEYIEGSMSLEDVKKELTDLGVKFHPATGLKRLSETLFEASGGTDVAVETKVDDNFLKDLENQIKSVKKAKASASPKQVTYISKNNNLNLSPLGVNKKGVSMRYVEGYSTLSVEEQRRQGDVFKIRRLLFKGTGMEQNMNGFIGRGALSTADATLQEFLDTHQKYGSWFTRFDSQEIARTEQEKDEKITLLKAGIYKASEDDLIRIITYIELMGTGSDNFSSYYNRSDMVTLKRKAVQFALSDPDTVTDALNSKLSKVVFLVNLAKAMDFIKVSANGREVILKSTNAVIVQSSLSTGWHMDTVDYLVTPDGRRLLEKLEMLTGYHVS